MSNAGIVGLGKYLIKPVKKGFVIERPNGTHVNEWIFKDKGKAEAYLQRLRDFRYCK